MAIATPSHELSRRISGDVLTPADPGWDSTRQAFNLLVDQRPEVIVVPGDTADVVRAVEYARARGLRVAPQSTGHNAGPLGSLDGTLLLHMSRLSDFRVDGPGRRVRAGAGTKWERILPQLSALGLAGLHGSSPDVAIAGYSLGGGMGWLARRHGLQANAVRAIELVTADGRLVRTDAEHEPELFWALRGGGGNFGAVTAVEFAVHPVPELYAGALFFGYERARDVLHSWSELRPSLPEELMTWVDLMQFPDVAEVPPPLRGRAMAVLFGVLLGPESIGRELLEPMRSLGPEIDTFAMVRSEALGPLAMDPTEPLPYRSAHALLDTPTGGFFDDLVDLADPAAGSPLAFVDLRHMGGALARTAPGAGARATMPGELCMVAVGVVEDAAMDADVRTTLSLVESLARPHRAGEYPNFVEQPADARAFFDAPTWERLRRVKAGYDPDDLFKANHPIPPA